MRSGFRSRERARYVPRTLLFRRSGKISDRRRSDKSVARIVQGVAGTENTQPPPKPFSPCLAATETERLEEGCPPKNIRVFVRVMSIPRNGIPAIPCVARCCASVSAARKAPHPVSQEAKRCGEKTLLSPPTLLPQPGRPKALVSRYPVPNHTGLKPWFLDTRSRARTRRRTSARAEAGDQKGVVERARQPASGNCHLRCIQQDRTGMLLRRKPLLAAESRPAHNGPSKDPPRLPAAT